MLLWIGVFQLKNKLRVFLNSLLGKLIISYVIIIFFACLLNYISYWYMYDTLKTRVLADNTNDFNVMVNDCEKKLLSLKKYMLYIDSDMKFQKIINSRNFSDYEVYELKTLLENRYFERPEFAEVWIYHKDSDFIVTKTASYSKQFFWASLYNNEYYNSDFWDDRLNYRSSFDMLDPASFYDYSSYDTINEYFYMPILYTSTSNKLYYLCSFIDINKFTKNNIKVSLANRTDVDFNAHTLKFFSEQNDIYYYADVDYKGIKKQMYSISLKFSILTVFSIIICLLFALYLSVRLNLPVKNISKVILPKSNDENSLLIDLNIIRGQILELISMNTRHKSEIETMDMQLQRYIFQETIRNNIFHDTILNQKFLFGNGFYIVCIKAHHYSIVDTDFKMYDDYFLKFIKYSNNHYNNSVCFTTDNSNIVILLCIEDNDLNLILNSISIALSDITEQKYYFTISASTKQSNINNIKCVYEKLILLHKKRNLDEVTQIIYENDNTQKNDNYYFSINKVTCFTNYLASGNEAEAIALMKSVLKNNYVKNTSRFQFSMLCNEFINLCIKIMVQKYSYLPDGVHSIETNTIIMTLLSYNQYIQICEAFVVKTIGYINKIENESDYIIDYVVGYIQENYGKDIYLDLFAEKLNLTNVYISKHFKEKIGINFSDFLNIYRIKIACERLKNSSELIKNIAIEVGIGNVNSFIRTFKKYQGQTPNNYRRSLNI